MIGEIMDDRITYEDIEEHSHLFTLLPTFVLKTMARTNSNLVSKFNSSIRDHLDNLTPDQRIKLNIILNSDIDDLQDLMREAFRKTKKKQYEILANPSNKEFIEKNLNELRKII